MLGGCKVRGRKAAQLVFLSCKVSGRFSLRLRAGHSLAMSCMTSSSKPLLLISLQTGCPAFLCTVQVVDEQTMLLLFVYRRNYFDATDALVYVIDSFDRKRIVESGSELDIILEVSITLPCPGKVVT
eukprot:1157358-Pelagomonas_calceolata.AAC.3